MNVMNWEWNTQRKNKESNEMNGKTNKYDMKLEIKSNIDTEIYITRIKLI